jgi:hypothetical protein
VEQDRVAEVTDLPVRHRVHARLVDEEGAHDGRVDLVETSLAGETLGTHARTILNAKPS